MIPRFYVVKEGDTLSRLAQRFYRDGNRWPSIFKMNFHRITTDPRNATCRRMEPDTQPWDWIFPGQQLELPSR